MYVRVFWLREKASNLCDVITRYTSISLRFIQCIKCVSRLSFDYYLYFFFFRFIIFNRYLWNSVDSFGTKDDDTHVICSIYISTTHIGHHKSIVNKPIWTLNTCTKENTVNDENDERQTNHLHKSELQLIAYTVAPLQISKK